MSFTNQTQHYGLPQYIGSDVPSYLGDFNGAMLAIDNGMNAAKTSADSAAASASQASADINTINQTLTTQASQISAAAQSASQAQTSAGQALNKAQAADSKADQALAAVGAGAGVANIQVTATGWNADATSGRQKKTISVVSIAGDNPNVGIGVASGAVAPTDAQIADYGKLVAVQANKQAATLDLYASAVPDAAFYIMVSGVVTA